MYFRKDGKHLSGWNMRTLSLAGRCTLAQSVPAPIPAYAMWTMKIPASICEKIDKIRRDFIWDSKSENRRIHIAGWDTKKLRRMGDWALSKPQT